VEAFQTEKLNLIHSYNNAGLLVHLITIKPAFKLHKEVKISILFQTHTFIISSAGSLDIRMQAGNFARV
jgi:hypothetical protein